MMTGFKEVVAQLSGVCELPMLQQQTSSTIPITSFNLLRIEPVPSQ
jgi:hypothetical protein